MKKSGITSFAFVFAGCFLGAGYVSGQEILQFFVCFNKGGILSLVISFILIFIFSMVLLIFSKETENYKSDTLIFGEKTPILRTVFIVAEFFLLFSMLFIICAGAGSIFSQLYNIPVFVGSLIFAFTSGIFAARGIKPVEKVINFIVPILLILILIVCIWVLTKAPLLTSPEKIDIKNPFVNNSVFSSAVYISYNFLVAIGILLPFSEILKSKSDIIRGGILGLSFILITSVLMFLSMYFLPGTQNSSVPMIIAANSCSPFLGYLYSFILLLGMFSSSVSVQFALINFVKKSSGKTYLKKQNYIVFLFSLIAFIGSLSGFKRLIGTIYPVFGCFGFIVILCISINFIKYKFNIHKISCYTFINSRKHISGGLKNVYK